MAVEILERILRAVLELGYTGTWVILAVLLLRCILQKAPKKYSYMLWAIPAIRLLVPVPFTGIWELFQGLAKKGFGKAFFQAMGVFHDPSKMGAMLRMGKASGNVPVMVGNEGIGNKAANVAAQAGDRIMDGIAALADGRTVGNMPAIKGDGGIGRLLQPLGNGVSESAAAQAQKGMVGNVPALEGSSALPSPMQAMALIWMAGMLLFLGWNISSYLRLRKKLQISMKWKDNIYFADGITHPFVLAGFPDKIYLPSSLDRGEASYILLHEQIHVKRKDPFFNMAATCILGVYWFHPMVWAGVHYFRQDMEMSCDEAAVKGLDEKGVKAYALDLLRFSVSREQWLQFPCAFGEKGITVRIMNLKKKKAKTKASLGLASAAVVAAAMFLLPNVQGVYGSEVSQETINESGKTTFSGVGNAIRRIGASDGGAGTANGVPVQKGGIGEKGGQNAGKQQKQQSLQGSLEQYFTELYSVLSDDAKDFSSQDFASTEGYMVGKRLMQRRYLGNVLYGGIRNVRLSKVEIQGMSSLGNQIKAQVFVEASFDYGVYSGLSEKAKSEMDYDLYEVLAMREEGGYKVLDISSAAECYARAKESLAADGVQDIAKNYEAVDAYYEKMQAYQESLERYFMELYSVLLDDTKDFSHEDFASTNGYIIGRELVSRRYSANVLYGGMGVVKMNEVDIQDISEKGDGIELMVHVKFLHSDAMDPDDLTSEGNLYQVFVVPVENGYKVLDLDTNSKEQVMAKESLALEDQSNIESNYEGVDRYFEEIDRNADSMLADWEK